MAVKARKGVEDLPVFIPAKSKEAVKRELGQKDMIKLSANENRMGCSKRVPEALKKLTDEFSSYPDVGCTILKEKVAAYHKVKEEQLVFGNGSFELIRLLAEAYLEEGDEVITPIPSFGWYITASLQRGAVIKKVPLTNHEIDLKAILDEITEQTKIIWLCNPNNPTGRLILEKDIKSFLNEVPETVLIVLDEAYIDFVQEGCPDSIAFLKNHENFVILRTFSKLYGLASFRIGYAIADENIIRQIEKVKLPINVSAAAQIAAEVSLDDEEFKKAVLENNQRGLALYYQTFQKWNLEYIESYGNFLMVNISADSSKVEQELMKQGILVRNGEGFGFPGWLRITVGTYEENKKLLDALGGILKKR